MGQSRWLWPAAKRRSDFRCFALFPRCARGRKPKISAPYSPPASAIAGPTPAASGTCLHSGRQLPPLRHVGYRFRVSRNKQPPSPRRRRDGEKPSRGIGYRSAALPVGPRMMRCPALVLRPVGRPVHRARQAPPLRASAPCFGIRLVHSGVRLLPGWSGDDLARRRL